MRSEDKYLFQDVRRHVWQRNRLFLRLANVCQRKQNDVKTRVRDDQRARGYIPSSMCLIRTLLVATSLSTSNSSLSEVTSFTAGAFSSVVDMVDVVLLVVVVARRS